MAAAQEQVVRNEDGVKEKGQEVPETEGCE